MTNKYFYSKQTGSFYQENMRGDYVTAGTWPTDTKEITAEEYAALLSGQGDGGVIVCNDAGRPILAAPQQAPFSQVASAYLDTVRIVRDQILNRISGIGFAAVDAGDNVVVRGATTTRKALLDITTRPEVLAAVNEVGLKQAIAAAFQEIMTAAPEELRKAFNMTRL